MFVHQSHTGDWVPVGLSEVLAGSATGTTTLTVARTGGRRVHSSGVEVDSPLWTLSGVSSHISVTTMKDTPNTDLSDTFSRARKTPCMSPSTADQPGLILLFPGTSGMAQKAPCVFTLQQTSMA